MKCNILHETPGRMRVHLALRRMSLREADLLEYDLKGVAGVASVKVFDRTQDAVITYTCPRMDIVRALASFLVHVGTGAFPPAGAYVPCAQPRV